MKKKEKKEMAIRPRHSSRLDQPLCAPFDTHKDLTPYKANLFADKECLFSISKFYSNSNLSLNL